MAQVSYGTITITDTNDIEEIFSLYGGSNDANTSPTYSYAAVTGGTTWKRNVTAITNYKYIWQITAITKTGITVDSSNWQQFYGAPIRITGEEGDDARNITAVTPYYYLSSSDSGQTDGGWSTSPQAYPSTGVYYYWTKTITTYDSGSPSESTPVLDMFLTNAAKDARDANATAALANSIAQHANEDAQGAMGQAASNVNEVKRIWYAQAAATPVPAAPTTGITTSATHDAWSITKPAANESYQYYFYCEQTKTGGGVYSWSEVILDTSTLSQYQIGAMSAKVRNYWWDSAGAHIASGTSTSGEISATSPTSSYGYNTLTGLTGISFRYNDAKVVDLNSDTPSLDFYQPPTISNNTVTPGKKTMMLSANALRFYNPTDGTTEQAILDSNGLKLIRGGIVAGSYDSSAIDSDQNFVYLSSEDYGIGTKIGDSASDKADWRQIIGNKFGVDKAGNLYAAGAHIDGDIVAQSLTIGSGANAYSGIAAINISGYSIEIEVVDIAGSTNTKKLIPHLYHNGMNADSEVTDVTKFLWYIDNNMSVPGAAGLSPDGYIIGEYGHTYKVIYDFGDGVVGSGSAIQTRTVDPQKYITRIDANGITIHPETQNGNSSIRLDGTGLTIYDSNGAYLAKYGSTITLGNAENINNNFNIKITNTVNTEDIIGNRGPGILLRKGTTVVNEITENGMKIYGLYVSPGSQVYNFGQLANFGGETKIGATNYTKINENEVGFYRNNNICLGKIDFTETIKNDCIYSFNHMWEDETQLTDTYTESIESYDGLGVTRVKGNFQYMTSSTNVLEEEEFDFDITQSSINTYTISDWFTMDIGILSESWVAEGSLIQEVGYNATTDNTFSYFKINFIIYYDTYSEGPRYIFGKDVNSIGQYSFAMGNNTIAREDCQLTIGKFNIPTDDALFVIGNGVNDNNRSNLMTISDSNICIGKGVETQYNNQFICGRYNEDYENILFAVGNGFNDTHRHNILSAHDVIGHDTDYITDTIEITVPVQTSYISLSNHPLTIEQILVNGINKTNDFSISTANDTILYPNIQLTIGDIVKVTYTIIQRYQIVNINDTYIGTLPGQTGNFITITEEHDFNSSWTFTIPNTIYPSSIFYLLTATGAGGTPRVTEELVQGVAKSIEYYGYTITYNGAYTLSYIYDEDEMHLVTSRRFKGVQYSTEPTISSENGIWMPFGALDDPQLYTIIQRFNWLDDVTKDIILT